MDQAKVLAAAGMPSASPMHGLAGTGNFLSWASTKYESDVDKSNDEEEAVTVGANIFFNPYAKLMLNNKLKNEGGVVDHDEFVAQLQVRFQTVTTVGNSPIRSGLRP